MQANSSQDLIEKWLKGWSLSRQLPLPTTFKSGFKVDVGYEKQKTRYVFPGLHSDFIDLARSIVEPWVFLKVCAAPRELERVLPPRWMFQPQGYMMTCFQRMVLKPVTLGAEYKMELTQSPAVYHVTIRGKENALAAEGRLVLVDDLAIYDRISTDTNHRRKGLATVIMAALEEIALSRGVARNFLVATKEGKLLYESLGWELHCFYTSVVIPAD
jgi:hypothetical protein